MVTVMNRINEAKGMDQNIMHKSKQLLWKYHTGLSKNTLKM